MTYHCAACYSVDNNGHPYGLEDSFGSDDWDAVSDFIWTKLNDGLYVLVKNTETGMYATLDPDIIYNEYPEDDIRDAKYQID